MSGGWTVAFALLTLVTLSLCVCVLALARYVASLATRLPEPLPLELTQGPEVGSYLADQLLPESVQARVSERVSPTARTLIVFLSTSCSSCYRLATELNRFARDARDTSVIVAVAGDEERGRRFENAIDHRSSVLLDVDGRMTRSFGISTVPFAIFYEDGLLKAKGVANTRAMLENLAGGFTRKGGDELLAAFTGGSS